MEDHHWPPECDWLTWSHKDQYSIPRGSTETYNISDGHYVVLKSFPEKTSEQHIKQQRVLYI